MTVTGIAVSRDRPAHRVEVVLVLGLQVQRRRAADPERRERRERDTRPDAIATPLAEDPQRRVEIGAHAALPLASAIDDPRADGVAEHPDVAAPHRHDQVAFAHLSIEERHDVASVRQVDGPQPGCRELHTVDHELAR